MVLFVLGAALLAAAVLALLVAPRLFPDRARLDRYSGIGSTEKNPARGYTRLAAVVAAVLGLVLLVSSFINYVPPRQVGVETVWGKYSRTLEAGVHPAVPWAAVETFPTTFQESAPEVAIGFSGGYGGTQPIKAQWTITSAEAKALWEKFRTFDTTNKQLVDNAINEETVRVFRDYTPSQVVNEEGVAEKIRADIQAGVTGRLAPYGVTVDSLSYTSAVRPDEDAKAAIKKDQDAIANLTRSRTEVETAENQAKADEIRNREATPESIQLACLDVLRTWSLGNNGPAPATLNCALDGSGATPVIVNTDQK